MERCSNAVISGGRENFNVSKGLRMISNYVVVEGLWGEIGKLSLHKSSCSLDGKTLCRGSDSPVIHIRIIAPFCDVPNFLMCPAPQEESEPSKSPTIYGAAVLW